MSLYGSFDRSKLLSELGEPFDSQGEGVLSAAAQRLTALRNLTGDSDIVLADITFLSDVTASAAELNYLDIATLGTGAASKAVVLDAGDDYTWPAAGILTYGVLKDPAGTTLGATVAELNAKADQSANYVLTVAADTTRNLTAAQSGLKFYLVDFDAACTINFPAEAAGLEYEFIYVGNAADAHGIILTSGSDTNYFTGGVVHIDTDANDAGDEAVPVHPDGNSNSKLTAATIDAGTRFSVKCIDGVTWVIEGAIAGTGAPVFADQ